MDLSDVPSSAADYEHQGSLLQRLNLYRPISHHDNTVAFLKAVGSQHLPSDPVVREQEALRRDCLKRDENKCVLYGVYDAKYSQVPAGGKR